MTENAASHISANSDSAPPVGVGRETVFAGTAVLLAPLSGITDVPFRRLVRTFGTLLVFSEMVASGQIIKGVTESQLRAASSGDGIHAVQLAGRDAAAMKLAAECVVDNGADLIDINMGCPAKKVVGGASGSALMRDLDHALHLIEATLAGAKGVPVTVKMRLGWDAASINAPVLARRAQEAGVAWVTVHGRTRDQFYDGTADWSQIRAVKAAVDIPVVANGDLTQRSQHAIMLRQSQADAVMVGRGATGRPWFPAWLEGTSPPGFELWSFETLVCGHYDEMLSYYGTQIGLRHARKHLGWYLDRLSHLDSRIHDCRSLILRSNEAGFVSAQMRKLTEGVTIGDVDPELFSVRKAA